MVSRPSSAQTWSHYLVPSSPQASYFAYRICLFNGLHICLCPPALTFVLRKQCPGSESSSCKWLANCYFLPVRVWIGAMVCPRYIHPAWQLSLVVSWWEYNVLPATAVKRAAHCSFHLPVAWDVLNLTEHVGDCLSPWLWVPVVPAEGSLGIQKRSRNVFQLFWFY